MVDQSALRSIDEISGNNPATNLSGLQGTMPNYHFGDVTRANFKGSQVDRKQSFNPAEVIKNFSDNGAVGINPFSGKLPEGAGEKMHVIG